MTRQGRLLRIASPAARGEGPCLRRIGHVLEGSGVRPASNRRQHRMEEPAAISTVRIYRSRQTPLREMAIRAELAAMAVEAKPRTKGCHPVAISLSTSTP